jgi:peptidoglycan hydrolase-like protein with peptidoglycan-binding domain
MTMNFEVGIALGTSGAEVAELHVALRAIGLEVDVEERGASHFGSSTAAAVAKLQGMSGLPETGVLDAETIAVISAALKKRDVRPEGSDGWPVPQAVKQYVVTGTVTDTDGEPLAGAVVVAFDCDLRSTREFGRAETDPKGAYRIAYSDEADPIPGRPGPDVKVQLLDGSGEPRFTSTITFNAPAQTTIDIMLGGPQHDQPSELSLLVATVSPLLGEAADLQPVDLLENDQHQDLSFLSGETEIPKLRLAYWTLSARMGQKTEVATELFYALLRMDVPATARAMALAASTQGVDLDGNAQRILDAILTTTATTLAQAVHSALAVNIVSASYADRADADIARLGALSGQAVLDSSRGFGNASLGAVFDTLKLGGDTQDRFVQLYSGAPWMIVGESGLAGGLSWSV